MSEKIKRVLKTLARLGAFAVVALLAFGAGALLFGNKAGVQSDGKAADHAAAHQSEEDTIWTCSMHPSVRQHEPGKCPICGMDLIPVQAGAADEGGDGSVVWTQRAKKLAQIRTVEVARLKDPSSTIRLLGKVEPAETALRTITAWIGGRIDKLHVKVTGQTIKAGQVVATLYSPEIFAAHQDLLVAKRQVEQLSQAGEVTRHAAQATLTAAREKLRLLGVPDGEIDAMERQTKPRTQVPIRTPFGGTVTERLATEGSYVSMGAPLYSVTNLYSLWVQLDAYESDLSAIQIGQKVKLEADALPGEEFEGKVGFIDPSIDPVRRTIRIRVEVHNPKRRLLPGMFVEAVISGASSVLAKSPLVIPASAPLFTGRRAVVYMEKPGAEHPTYEARSVRLGSRLGDSYPVVSGLSEGERVVMRGAFAIDADLQIKGGASMMTEPDDTQVDPESDVRKLSAEDAAKLRAPFETYLKLQESLAADDIKGAREAVRQLGSHVSKTKLKGAGELWNTAAHSIEQQAKTAAQADSLEALRGPFEIISLRFESLLRVLGNPLKQPIHLAYCPMAFDNKGANWLQKGEVIDNPYFGDAMRTCGEIKAKVDSGQYLPPARSGGSPSDDSGGHVH